MTVGNEFHILEYKYMYIVRVWSMVVFTLMMGGNYYLVQSSAMLT